MKLMQYTQPLAWPTFGRLSSLQDELNHLFDSSANSWVPALDVHEDKESYTVCVELPGLNLEDIQVQLQDDSLVISGERKGQEKQEGTEIHRQERSYGKFSRALTFPTAVNGDKIKASYKAGVLTVTVPKTEEAKPKQITISDN